MRTTEETAAKKAADAAVYSSGQCHNDDMHCYCIGPIDWWDGAMTRAALIHSTRDSVSMNFDALQEFENRAMVQFRRIGWEGDISSGPYFFALPLMGMCELGIGIIYKQVNNGSCFVASPVPLPYLGDA